MFSDSILNLFRLRVSGDDGTDDSGNQSEKTTETTQSENSDDSSSGNESNQESSDRLDLSTLPEGAQKIIKDLRAENAKHRTSNNNLSTEMEKFKNGLKNLFGEGDDDVDPSVQLETVQGNYESAVTRNAILSLALDNGISGKENVEYFEFLMNKAMSNLKEGEELTEEQLESIITQSTPKKGNATTSTSTDDAAGKKADDSENEVTQEEFNKMGMTQKSLLYRQKPELYNKLLAGARL